LYVSFEIWGKLFNGTPRRDLFLLLPLTPLPMKYEVISIIDSYKDKKLTSVQSMDAIISLFTPDESTRNADDYIARLIGFMFDVNPDTMFNNTAVREGINTLFQAKSMLSKVLHEKWKRREGKENLIKFATSLGLTNVQSVYYRLKQHDVFYETNREYKHIYDIVKRVV
jgi:hypothetical protein